ncbi:5-azacytidine resistance protein azr1/azr1 protein [Blumeria hordei DH14]|uniref:Protein phosphatase n=1 Tax=Blumeria graminis f. sp. hordei (strain DH14) TaxID=546991 RepID=N1JIW2_BLUG1|nr:5-azacytidine resistance protein azr1/azr1 protein [Blumeria hordei DH14]
MASSFRIALAEAACSRFAGKNNPTKSRHYFESILAPRRHGRRDLRLPCSQRQIRSFHHGLPLARYTFGVAASYSAKNERFDSNKNTYTFNYEDSYTQRRDKSKRPASGQDSFFVSRVGESSDVALGVADGVGSWGDIGVDPGDFSHGICELMAYASSTHHKDKTKAKFGARSLMQRGYEGISTDKSVLAGSSTACVAVARGDGNLEVANLGDSGFIQLRLNAIHNASEPQTHGFNTPYQLAVVPDFMKRKSSLFGGPYLSDLPQDAIVSQCCLQHGDVLMFASDGVWDNLSRSEILKIVSKIMLEKQAWKHTSEGVSVGQDLSMFLRSTSPTSLQSALAVSITTESKVASMSVSRDGPFAREVHKYYPQENYRGGKVDDICVLVAIACEE